MPNTNPMTNAVTVSSEPVDALGRYVLVYPDAPTLVTIHGMIDNYDAEDLLAIIVIANDGTSEAVHVEEEEDGTWIVVQSSAAGAVVEEVRYATTDDAAVLHHVNYVPGFTSDQVPEFVTN